MDILKKGKEQNENRINNEEKVEYTKEQTHLAGTLQDIDAMNTIETNIATEQVQKALEDGVIDKAERELLQEIFAMIEQDGELNDMLEYFESDELTDEYKKLYKLGYRMKDIKTILLKIRKKNTEKKLQTTTLNKLVTNDIYEHSLEKLHNEKTSIINNEELINQVAYLIEHKKQIEKEKYEKLMKEFWEEVIMQYLEKKVEIYEIKIDANGNIVITMGDGKIITINNTELQGFSPKFIELKLQNIFGKEHKDAIKKMMSEALFGETNDTDTDRKTAQQNTDQEKKNKNQTELRKPNNQRPTNKTKESLLQSIKKSGTL